MRSAPGSPRASLAVVLVSACLVVLVWPAVAGADIFSPIRLVSYGMLGGDPEAQQAEYGHDAAISADGRYVAFDGSVGGVTGVWRRDLQSGAIEQVAGGDAALPSISADGNEISFTTNEGDSLPEVSHERPDADPRPEAVNVYVRDMANSPAGAAAEEAARAPAERAFLIVSAPSGSSEPLRYTAPPTQATAQGSYAAGRSAISADGSEVAFVTTAISNLVAYPALEAEERSRGETPAPHTPAGQVVVRYLRTETTELVSRCRSGCEPGAAEALVAGAAAVGEADFPGHPAAGGGPGASISADGSTVAWLGASISSQAPTLAAERLEPEYREPLWRRLPAAATQTVRISGGGDPANPACAASGETAPPSPPSLADPCQGPFVLEHAAGGGEPGGLWKGKSAGNSTPQLSEHGNVVAFLAQARLVGEGSDFGRGEGGQESDVYVANMEPGLSRVQALTPLSEVGPPNIGAESDPVGDLAISPDGGEVAFTSVADPVPARQPRADQPAPGRPRRQRALRRGSARGHDHARHARDRRRRERTAPRDPEPERRRPLRRQPRPQPRSLLARVLRRRQHARVHLHGQQPRLRRRQHAGAHGGPAQALRWARGRQRCVRRLASAVRAPARRPVRRSAAGDEHRARVAAGRRGALARGRNRAALRRGPGRGRPARRGPRHRAGHDPRAPRASRAGAPGARC